MCSWSFGLQARHREWATLFRGGAGEEIPSVSEAASREGDMGGGKRAETGRRLTDEVTGDGLDDHGADDVGVVLPLVKLVVGVVVVCGSASKEGPDGQDSCLHTSRLDHSEDVSDYSRCFDLCLFCICVCRRCAVVNECPLKE